MEDGSGWRPSVGDTVWRLVDGKGGPPNKVVQLTVDGRYVLCDVTSDGVTFRQWVPVSGVMRVPWDEFMKAKEEGAVGRADFRVDGTGEL